MLRGTRENISLLASISNCAGVMALCFLLLATTVVVSPQTLHSTLLQPAYAQGVEEEEGTTDTGAGEEEEGTTDTGAGEEEEGTTDTGAGEEEEGTTDTGAGEEEEGTTDTGAGEEEEGTTDTGAGEEVLPEQPSTDEEPSTLGTLTAEIISNYTAAEEEEEDDNHVAPETI